MAIDVELKGPPPLVVYYRYPSRNDYYHDLDDQRRDAERFALRHDAKIVAEFFEADTTYPNDLRLPVLASAVLKTESLIDSTLVVPRFGLRWVHQPSIAIELMSRVRLALLDFPATLDELRMLSVGMDYMRSVRAHQGEIVNRKLRQKGHKRNFDPQFSPFRKAFFREFRRVHWNQHGVAIRAAYEEHKTFKATCRALNALGIPTAFHSREWCARTLIRYVNRVRKDGWWEEPGKYQHGEQETESARHHGGGEDRGSPAAEFAQTGE